MRFEISSTLHLCSLIVMTFMIDIFTAILQQKRLLLLPAPYSGLSLPDGFKGKTSCDCCKSMSAQGDVAFVGTLTLVLYTFAIIYLHMLIILWAHVLQYDLILVVLPHLEPCHFPRPRDPGYPAGTGPELLPSLRGKCGLSCKQSGDNRQVGWWNCHFYMQLG